MKTTIKKLLEWLLFSVLLVFVLIECLASPFDDVNPKFYDPYE
jgi:hypothetical protein